MTIDPGHLDGRRLSRRQLLQDRRARPGRARGRPPRRGPDPAPGGSLISAQTTEATGLDPAARPRALAQPALAADVQPARALRRPDDADPRAGRVVGDEQGRPHLDLQAAPGGEVPRRPGDDHRGREVHVRPPLREEPGQVRLHRGGQGRAGRQVRGEVRHQGALRGPARRAGRLLGLHHQRGRASRSTAISTRPRSAPGPSCWSTGRSSRSSCSRRTRSYFKKGQPYVDDLVLRVIPDEANIVAALRTGQIQHAFIEDNKNYNLLKDEKTLTGYRSSRLGYDYLNITATRGPLKDVRVRQAISWAVDRSQVLRVAAAGFGRLTAPATAPMKQWQLPEEAWMKYYKPDVERGQEAHGRGRAERRLHRQVHGDPHLPHHGVRGAGDRGPAQAHRHQHGDRERGVRDLDQAVARPRLRHDDEHHAGLRRSRHRVLPRAPLHQGPELEQLERARAGRGSSRRAGAPWTRRSARRSTTACRS